MSRLLIVDGSNLLFQMFFGMPSRITNAEGKAIQGALGFVGALLKIIRRTGPTHIAVLFDGEHENERTELNADYKANRVDYSQTPEEDSPFSQLPDVYAALDYMGIKHNISLIHENNRYADLIEIISDYKPSWLYIQPYILNKLLNIYAEKNQTPPASLKYIEVYGEMVFPGLKERVKEVFNVPIAIMYGSEEMNCIAYEWHENKMQIVNENVFVEHLSDGHISDCTGEGIAIITNLNNHAMPLIRYDQGDVISLEADKAKFEYHIVSIKGRKLDSIMVNKNTEINSFILQEIIAEANNQFKDIISFYRYFYYARERELRCSINVKKMEWFDSVKEFIKSSFKMKVGNIGITFEVNRSFDENDFKNKFKFLEIIN